MLCCGNADTHVTYGLFVIVENAQWMDVEKIEVSEFTIKDDVMQLIMVFVFGLQFTHKLMYNFTTCAIFVVT